MWPRWLSISIVAAFGAPVARAAEITALPVPTGAGIERGVAVVLCATESKDLVAHSRAAVLDVGSAANAEVLLTTAHGLPPDAQAVKRDCRVGVRGIAYRIAEVWHSGGNLRGPEQDWAVIALEGRIAGDVHRWRVAHFSEKWLTEAAADGAPVRLVLRYADARQSDCRLEPRTSDPRLLLAHSCVSYDGMSGTPLVVALDVEPEPVLIGVQVGWQLQWRGRELDSVNVARPVDAAVVAAIEAAAKWAQAAPSIEVPARASARGRRPR